MTEAEIMIQLLGDLLQKVEEQDEQLRAMQSHLLSVESSVLGLSTWSQSQELRLSQQHEVQERHLKGLLGQLSQATKEHLGQLSEAEKAAQQLKAQVKTHEATSAHLSNTAKSMSLKMWAAVVAVGLLAGVGSVGVLGVWMWPQLKQELLHNTGLALAVFKAEQEEQQQKSQAAPQEASDKAPSKNSKGKRK